MHEKRIDLRWRDLDAYGHVNQAVYLTFGEEVLDDWFRSPARLSAARAELRRRADDDRIPSELRLRTGRSSARHHSCSWDEELTAA